MIIRSFQKQIQQLFSAAAYKTSGVHIGCLPVALPQSPLSFKIDIAQRLYRSYELNDFKFCEKGTTPRSVAQEIAIFTHQNPHYLFQIDSFGSISVSPTSLYYKKMKESILNSGKLRHTLLHPKPECLKIQNQSENFSIFYRIEDLSLSSLRLVKQLEVYTKVKVKLNEYPIQRVKKIIDLTSLNLQQVRAILNYQIIDTVNFSTSFIVPKHTYKDLLVLLQNYNLNFAYEWQRTPNNIMLTGCIRHKYIQFLANTKGIVDQNTDEIIKVGQVFPQFTIHQLKATSDQAGNQLSKIMSYCMQVDNLLPINLRDLYQKPHFPLTGLRQCLKGRTSSESILLLLQNVSSGKVAQSLDFLNQARERELFANQQQIYNIMVKYLTQLLL